MFFCFFFFLRFSYEIIHYVYGVIYETTDTSIVPSSPPRISFNPLLYTHNVQPLRFSCDTRLCARPKNPSFPYDPSPSPSLSSSKVHEIDSTSRAPVGTFTVRCSLLFPRGDFIIARCHLCAVVVVVTMRKRSSRQ